MNQSDASFTDSYDELKQLAHYHTFILNCDAITPVNITQGSQIKVQFTPLISLTLI